MRDKLHWCSGILALAIVYLFHSHSSQLNFFNDDPNFSKRAVEIFVGGTVFLGAINRLFSRDQFLWAMFAASFLGCLYLFGLEQGLVVFITPALWLVAMHWLPGLASRLLLAAVCLALLYSFRVRGFFSLSFWWISGQWLRCLAVSFDWKKSAWQGDKIDRQSLRASILHFCATPFLLSPIPMEWITFSYFRENTEATESRGPPPAGAKLLWAGIGFLVLYELFRNYVEPFRSEAWQLERLNQLEGEGWFHLQAGWVFFLLRLWQYSALTALVAGAWQFLGFSLRYDFDMPLASRNGLDFWRRYHNFGREFLLRNIFYPSAFYFSRHLPWKLSAALGGALVFMMVVVVQATSLVPIKGVPFSTTYSWIGSALHTFWSVVFIAITAAFSAAISRIGARKPVATFLEICFTLTLLGWLFYNSYAQLWSNFTNAAFLKAIFSW